MPGAPRSPRERSLRAQIAAHASWAKTPDAAARTARARAAFFDRFLREVDPDGTLPVDERARRAEHALRAHMLRLSLAAQRARAAKADQ
jgi:hypothetical protein